MFSSSWTSGTLITILLLLLNVPHVPYWGTVEGQNVLVHILHQNPFLERVVVFYLVFLVDLEGEKWVKNGEKHVKLMKIILKLVKYCEIIWIVDITNIDFCICANIPFYIATLKNSKSEHFKCSCIITFSTPHHTHTPHTPHTTHTRVRLQN